MVNILFADAMPDRILEGWILTAKQLELPKNAKKIADEFVYMKPSKPTNRELLPLLKEADILITRLWPLDRQLISASNRLLLIQKAGRCIDKIDLLTARKKRIPVAIAPLASHARVAEHTLALMFALARQIVGGHLALVKGERNYKFAKQEGGSVWHSSGTGFNLLPHTAAFNFAGQDLSKFTQLTGKTLGIIGLGEIGQEVALRAAALGMHILYYQRIPLSKVALDILSVPIRYVSFSELFSQSDYISIHVPLTKDTAKLIGRKELEQVKPGAYLINTSRGQVIDELALIDALESGLLGGAGLDVYENEPLPLRHQLLSLPNVVLSAHVASIKSNHSYEDEVRPIVENIVRIIQQQPPLNLIA